MLFGRYAIAPLHTSVGAGTWWMNWKARKHYLMKKSQRALDREQEKVEEALERLKLNGDVFEPKRGFISRIT